MDSITVFYREHRRIDQLASALESLTRLPGPPDPGEFLGLRSSLGDLVMQHLIREERVIYALLRASQRCGHRTLVGETVRDPAELCAAFAEYGRRWTGPRIAADWIGYCTETGLILARLRQRTAVEEDVVYPLIEREHMAEVERLLRHAV